MWDHPPIKRALRRQTVAKVVIGVDVRLVPWTCHVRWLGSGWSNGICRFGRARIGFVKEMSLSFDTHVDWDKRFVSGEPLSLWQCSSVGTEFHSERHVQDSSTGWLQDGRKWRVLEDLDERASFRLGANWNRILSFSQVWCVPNVKHLQINHVRNVCRFFSGLPNGVAFRLVSSVGGFLNGKSNRSRKPDWLRFYVDFAVNHLCSVFQNSQMGPTAKLLLLVYFFYPCLWWQTPQIQ